MAQNDRDQSQEKELRILRELAATLPRSRDLSEEELAAKAARRPPKTSGGKTTMAQCKFCRKRFANPQAVRGHLQWCPSYHGGRERKAQSVVKAERPKARPAYKGSEPRAGGIAEPVLDELQAERAKLDLRKVRAEHRRLDDEDAERARHARERKEAARQQAEAESLAHEQAQLEAEERRRREAAEVERQRRRREIIQRVKDRAMNRFVSFLITIPREVETRARVEIERELASLPVEEMPERELGDIAEGIRERIYRPVIEAHEREQEARRQAQQEEFSRGLQRITEAFAPPTPEERQAREEAERRERRKRELISYGEQYASEELDEEGIRPGLERFSILRRVEQALTDRLTGTESRGKVEDLVEEILDEELGEE